MVALGGNMYFCQAVCKPTAEIKYLNRLCGRDKGDTLGHNCHLSSDNIAEVFAHMQKAKGGLLIFWRKPGLDTNTSVFSSHTSNSPFSLKAIGSRQWGCRNMPCLCYLCERPQIKLYRNFCLETPNHSHSSGWISWAACWSRCKVLAQKEAEMAWSGALGLPLTVPHLRGRRAKESKGTDCCECSSVRRSLCKPHLLLC